MCPHCIFLSVVAVGAFLAWCIDAAGVSYFHALGKISASYAFLFASIVPRPFSLRTFRINSGPPFEAIQNYFLSFTSRGKSRTHRAVISTGGDISIDCAAS